MINTSVWLTSYWPYSSTLCSSVAYKDYITDETLAAYTYQPRHSIPCGQFVVLLLIKCTIVSCLCAKQFSCLSVFSTKMCNVIGFRACLFPPLGQSSQFSAVPAMQNFLMKYERRELQNTSTVACRLFSLTVTLLLLRFVPLFNFLQIAIKPSSLSKMKTIFTQEIFTEQVHSLSSQPAHFLPTNPSVC